MSGRLSRYTLLAAAISLALPGSLLAATLNQNLSLVKATIYLQGAELQSQATIDVPKGESEIVLGNVAQAVNPDSLRINFGKQVELEAVAVQPDYLPAQAVPQNPAQKALSDLQAKQKQLQIELAATEQENKFLSSNPLFNLQGNSLDSARSAMDFVKTRFKENLTAQQNLQQQLAEVQRQLDKQQQLVGKNIANRDAIVLKINSPQAQSLPITVNYWTQQASWQPQYEVRVKDSKQPLQLDYKANIYQHTGLNWNNVLLTLSSANPADLLQLPQLSHWDVDIAKAQQAEMVMMASPRSGVFREAKMADQVDNAQLNTQGINVQYQLNEPYTIDEQRAATQVLLQSKQLTASYHYTATPKLSPATYLVAQLSDWHALNLLPGQMSVFYQDSYMGQQWLSPDNSKATVEIALGRDDNIQVARNIDVTKTERPKLIGQQLTQKFAYTIAVNNQKDQPIEITVYDQLPLLHDDSIKLSEMALSQAHYDPKTGLLSWQLKLDAKTQKQLPFSFSLQYPQSLRDKIIGL